MLLPKEFLVVGRPASVNKSKTKAPWKNKVADAALKVVALPPNPFAGASMVKVFWFIPAKVSYADVDNGIKPTIDGMAAIILADDRQVERVVAQRVSSASGTSLLVPLTGAEVLLNAIDRQLGLTTGVREFATAVKIEPYSPLGGDWW